MKIEVGTYALCAGVTAGENLEDGFRINGKRQTQQGLFLRAVAGKAFNRKNRMTSISFSVLRTHASFEAAEEYLLMQEAAIPDTGDVVFSAESATAVTRKFKLTDANIDAVEGVQIGVSTRSTYALLGGHYEEVTS